MVLSIRENDDAPIGVDLKIGLDKNICCSTNRISMQKLLFLHSVKVYLLAKIVQWGKVEKKYGDPLPAVSVLQQEIFLHRIMETESEALPIYLRCN